MHDGGGMNAGGDLRRGVKELRHPGKAHVRIAHNEGGSLHMLHVGLAHDDRAGGGLT